MPCHTPCGPEGARVRFRFKNRRRLRHLRGTGRTRAYRTCNTKRKETGLEKKTGNSEKMACSALCFSFVEVLPAPKQ